MQSLWENCGVPLFAVLPVHRTDPTLFDKAENGKDTGAVILLRASPNNSMWDVV